MESWSRGLMKVRKDQLKRIKDAPPGPLYQSINKHLAELYLENDCEEEAIYHLVESQAVSMRHRTVDLIEHLHVKSLNSANSVHHRKPGLEKKWLVLDSWRNDTSWDIMLERLKDLPPEWTVVQLTSGYDPRQFIGNPCDIHMPSSIHITELDMRAGRPFSMKLPISSGASSQSSNYLHDFHTKLDFMGRGLTNRLENVRSYQMKKLVTNVEMQTAVKQMETKWLQHWRCILIGRLVDEQLRCQVEAGLEKITCNIGTWKSSDTTLCVHLLYQTVLASYSLSVTEVCKVVAYVTGLEFKSAECKKISQDLHSLGKSLPLLMTAKRHPVILIVDDAFKRVPWETMSVLNGHPVSRMHSLHFLYALSKAYGHRIHKGVVQGVDPSKGHYIVNPDQTLNNMEARLKSVFNPRLPEWRGTFGVKPTAEQFGSALQDSDIFVYCGHGSGTQFLGNRQIQKLQVNAVALLFGCNSTGLTNLGGRAETWSTAQCYMMSCSPCVVGTLWNVTDTEIDKISANMLHYWLPPTQEMKEIIERYQKEHKKKGAGAVKDDFDFALVKNTSPSWEQVPELLDVVKHGRAASRLFIMSAAVVSIGLPVSLKS